MLPRRAGRWVEENCRVTGPFGGYSGGYEGWDRTEENKTDPNKLEWRSVEHNLDLAVAFEKLSRCTKGAESKEWLERAMHARVRHPHVGFQGRTLLGGRPRSCGQT